MWAFTSVDEANWHPITWLSHMLDVQLYGMNPGGHHLTSVVIHTVSSLLLLILLLRLTGAFWQSSFVAALFALHPLHVESVVWLAERKDVLSALFGFLTLIFYSEYIVTRKAALSFLSLFSFALGLMSKPMLVTVPIIMLLIDFWPLDRYQHYEKEQIGLSKLLSRVMVLIKEKMLYFVFSLISGIVTIYAQHMKGAVNSLQDTSFWLRITNALTAYVRYIGKALWPLDLAYFYPLPSFIPLWQVISSFILLLLVSITVIQAWRQFPYLLVGWFWFIITLIPVIGLLQVGDQSMADRYSYLPLIGLFIMVAWGASDLTKRIPHRDSILTVFASVVIISLVALTWKQIGYWRDNISLSRHALQVTPDATFCRHQLGTALFENGNIDAAILEYQTIIREKPYVIFFHNDLGKAYMAKGDFDAASKEFETSIRLFSEHYSNK